MRTADVIVVGGGIIGCASARELAARGLKVTLLEAGKPGREASWASAGMVAPQLEAAPAATRFFERCRRSRSLYPGFVRALEEAAGMSVGFAEGGSIGVALHPEEMEALAAQADWQKKAGLPAEVLDVEELRRRAPGVTPRALGGVFYPEDAWVDNRRLMQALLVALRRAGVVVRAGEPALRFSGPRGRVHGVRTPRESLGSGLVIDAAGAWASSIAGIPPSELRVEPVRGQMLMLEAHEVDLSSVMHARGVYLVPRGPRRILVGSTLEKVGFARGVTAAGVGRLLRRAVRLLPALGGARLVDAWSGFRPYAGRKEPIFAPSRRAGLWYATGHYRNGILLAPLSAREVADRLAARGRAAAGAAGRRTRVE